MFSLVSIYQVDILMYSIYRDEASLVAQLVKNPPVVQETPVRFLGWEDLKIPWRKDRLPTPVFMGFSGGLDSKESTHNVGDLGSIPGSGRSPGGGYGSPLHLENPMDRGAWWAELPVVAKSWTRLRHLALTHITYNIYKNMISTDYKITVQHDILDMWCLC